MTEASDLLGLSLRSIKNKWHCCDSVVTTSQNNPTRQGNWPQIGWCLCFDALSSKSGQLSFLLESEVLSGTAPVGLVFTENCLMCPKVICGRNSENKKMQKESFVCVK